MKFRISPLKTLIAALAIVVAVPTMAYATHTFPDVPTAKFYHDAVEWAFANGITTGTSPTTFSPEDPVTRGENITFAKRYDDNIVQPALSVLTTGVAANTADIATNTADIATNAADVDVLETNQVVGSARVLASGTMSDIYMVNGNTPTMSHVAASGVYTITWTGISVNINLRRAFAQIVGSTAGFANISSVSGDLIVNTFNLAGTPTDMQFGVLIFDD